MEKKNKNIVLIEFLPIHKEKFKCLVSVTKTKISRVKGIIKYTNDKLISTNTKTLCCLYLTNIIKEISGEFKEGALYKAISVFDDSICLVELNGKELFPDVLSVMSKKYDKVIKVGNYSGYAISSFNSYLTMLSPNGNDVYDYNLVKPFIKAVSNNTIDVSFQGNIAKLKSENIEFYLCKMVHTYETGKNEKKPKRKGTRK